ncbi:MAG: hypothetical protein IID45_15330 [Planctomycetes bacterium]|nr:hypothetical protein [Planctomycetota bacterium]
MNENSANQQLDLALTRMKVLRDVCRADYKRAAAALRKVARKMEQQQFENLMNTLPFSASSPLRYRAVQSQVESLLQVRFRQDAFRFTRDAFALAQLQSVHESLFTGPLQTAGYLFAAAVCDLEAGRTAEAAESLRRVEALAPTASYRSLIRLYLSVTTNKLIPITPPRIAESPQPLRSETSQP